MQGSRLETIKTNLCLVQSVANKHVRNRVQNGIIKYRTDDVNTMRRYVIYCTSDRDKYVNIG